MIKTPPKNPDETVLIPMRKLGQRGARGIWATAGYSDGVYGVMLGKTRGEDFSLAFFIPEPAIAEARQSLRSAPEGWRAVFESAIERLPRFKAECLGGFHNAERA